jgi:hypothetical protein
MLALDDPRWAALDGAHRQPYDAAPLLAGLVAGTLAPAQFWYAAWSELYHQDQVGVAAYAALPHLVAFYERLAPLDGDLVTFAAAVERVRRDPGNPPLPAWLAPAYDQSVRRVISYGCERIAAPWDAHTLKAYLMLIAAYKLDHALFDLLDCVEEGHERRAIDAYMGS